MSPGSFCGFCFGGGAVLCTDGDAVGSGWGAEGLTSCGANSRASSIAISSQATITASPISNTRQLGRPLPPPSMSDISPALGATDCGSRNRATTAIVNSVSVPARAAMTNIVAARLPPAAASGAWS